MPDLPQTNNIITATIKNLSKKYNDLNWIITCQMYDMYKKNVFVLETKNIQSIVFENNLISVIPYVKIRYKDYNNLLTPYFKKNGLVLKINMHTESLPGNNLDKEFYVEHLDIIQDPTNESNRTVTTYMISGFDFNMFKMLLHPNYSTDHSSAGTSTFKIIYDILNKIGYNFMQLNYDPEINIQFISGKNMEAIDIIDYCLARSISEKTPPTYFMTQLLSGKGQLFGGKANITKDNVHLLNVPSNTFKLEHVQKLTRENGIRNIENTSATEGFELVRLLENDTFYDFNHLQRKWSTTKYEHKKKINLLSNLNAEDKKTFASSLFTPTALDMIEEEYCRYYPNFSKTVIYPILINIELGSNCISFEVDGNLTYDCGQYIVLDTGDVNLKNVYEGLWNIYGCKHIFENGKYITSFACYSTYRYKSMNEK